MGAIAAIVGAAAALGAAGCDLAPSEANLVAGKEQFIARCGACHVLGRAGTQGTTGPNLDEAFQQALASGMKRSTIEGVTREQIANPRRNSGMPADLVTGQDAADVAAYVGEAVARGGEDTGPLASVGQAKQEPLARAENGVLTIPADPTGQLLYTFENAEAPAGPLTVRSPNESSVDHDIAIRGGGVDEAGPVVRDGGVSELEIDLSSGRYEFLCTVPGHAQAGMRGILTVG